jgi:hypothetical protein
VVITGFVPEDDLVTLYNLCHLFVFPSLHEGFGLPALEAMACGAPVIGSNTSSIPEVIGWKDALFDPTRPSAIAEAIAGALANEGFRQELRNHGLRQARLFSWDESARRALAAFEQLEAPNERGSMMEQSHATARFLNALVAAQETAEEAVKTLREQLQSQLESNQQRERELLQTVHQLQSQLESWQTIAESRKMNLQSILTSRSWRLTKPLRWISNLCRRRDSLRGGTE